MIIGGQKEDGRGHVLIYQSDDLINWDYLGEYGHASTIDHEGKMWECPDLFRLNGVNVLLMSPQGIKEDGEKYRNYHQTGYKIRDSFVELDQDMISMQRLQCLHQMVDVYLCLDGYVA